MSQASKKGLTGARKGAYVYGTMRKSGWAPSKGVSEHSPVKMKRRQCGMGSYKQCCDMEDDD